MKMVNGKFKHYKISPDGSLRLVGEVAYAHDVEPAPDFDTMLGECLGYDPYGNPGRAEEALDDMRKTAESFEAFVDLASETEG